MIVPILSLAAFAFASALAPHQAFAARKASGASAASESQAAGAGTDLRPSAAVLQNGQVLSFYESHIYVEPSNASSPDGSVDLPGVGELFKFISQAPYLSDETRGRYLNTIQPSDKRKYYRAIPAVLASRDNKHSDVYDRILEVYYRVTGVLPDRLTLAAVTDTHTLSTFILPPYDSMSPHAQVGALFHESYWIWMESNHNRYREDRTAAEADYKKATDAGSALEALLDRPSDAGRIYAFVNFVGNAQEIENAMVAWDYAAGSMNALLSENRSSRSLSLSAFYGKAGLECIERYEAKTEQHGSYYGRGGAWDECGAYVNQNLQRIKAHNPNSLTVQAIAKQIVDGNGAAGSFAPFRVKHHNWTGDETVFSDRTIHFNPAARPNESAIAID
jgi:hypothetical protein